MRTWCFSFVFNVFSNTHTHPHPVLTFYFNRSFTASPAILKGMFLSPNRIFALVLVSKMKLCFIKEKLFVHRSRACLT